MLLQFSLNKQNTRSMYRFNLYCEIFLYFFQQLPSLYLLSFTLKSDDPSRRFAIPISKSNSLSPCTDIRIKKKKKHRSVSLDIRFVVYWFLVKLNRCCWYSVRFERRIRRLLCRCYCQTFSPKHVPSMYEKRYPEAIRMLLSYGKLVFRATRLLRELRGMVEWFQSKGNRHEKRYVKSLKIVWKKCYRQNLKFKISGNIFWLQFFPPVFSII